MNARTLLELAWLTIRTLASLIWTMVSVSVVSLWIGVEAAIDRIAKDWQTAIHGWGVGTVGGPTVNRVCRIFAIPLIAVFWIVTAELTVLALRILF